MGNTSSLSSAFEGGSSGKGGLCPNTSSSKKSKGSKNASSNAESATERAKKVFGDVQESLKSSVKKLEEQDHPAAHLIDTVCGSYFDSHGTSAGNARSNRKMRENRSASFYSEDYNSDDSRTLSEDEQTLDTDYNASTINGSTVASSAAPTPSKKAAHIPTDTSYLSQSDYESSEVGNVRSSRNKAKSKTTRSRKRKDDDPSSTAGGGSDDDDSKTMDTNGTSVQQGGPQQLIAKPLASSFAKRCYFTKAGIGKTTQHYEGLTLTGNVVLMLAAAMKLKGCPTICDEDLRRVEQTYPNQFSRLPDELLLSSGWRRISKYCHFSNKPIPDGIPFFHSKHRIHPHGGYYFLLAAAVGMVRPIDVEPLSRDTLVLLETDYPTQCDAAPEELIQDPDEWTLVDKFCFFSGGPINTEEDVYYQADFDGNPIYMLAFLSPSLTPEELYKLEIQNIDEDGIPVPGLTSVAAVQEVESVYDLTDRDFHDLKLYHLGPCRALPQYILQPQAWTKVLPPHFLDARHRAIVRAQQYEMARGGTSTPISRDPSLNPAQQLTVGATPIDRYGPSSDYHHHLHHTHRAVDPSQPPPYDEFSPAHDQPIASSPHHLHQHYGHNMSTEENAYYLSPTGASGGDTPQHGQHQQSGFAAEYETVGQHHSTSMVDSHMATYPTNFVHQQQGYHVQQPHGQQTYLPDHHQQQQQPVHSHQYHQPDPYGSQGSPSQLQGHDSFIHHQDPMNQDDDPGWNSPSLQRDVEEEGAFVDSHLAPMDEVMNTRKVGPPGANMVHGMDPPEHLPPGQDPDESVVASEANNISSNVSGSYYSHPDDPQEDPYSPSSDVMQSPLRHGSEAPSFGTPASLNRHEPETPPGIAPQYSYSVSPSHPSQKGGDRYYHQYNHTLQQSRDDQYYDDTPDEEFTPDGLKELPSSHDHEFFNAPSGGGDEDEEYVPSNVSSFDPRGQVGLHPDDYQQTDDYRHFEAGSGYYEDEVDSRLEVQESSSSAEYYRGGPETSPSPIKMDHLRRLGRKTEQEESPHHANVNMTSPTSLASSQNSVSEYSHSSAMRGAQELLKRNRLRRHEQARRRLNAATNNEGLATDNAATEGSPVMSDSKYEFAAENGYPRRNAGSPGVQQQRGDDGSASTWESANSEALNSVISGSSVWTDNSSNPADRSSRRALILQMAKARMKSNKERDPAEKTIKEEKSNSLDDTDVDDYGDDHSDMRPQELTDVHSTSATELDIAADLD